VPESNGGGMEEGFEVSTSEHSLPKSSTRTEPLLFVSERV
jgi:hypothetical protein